MIYKNLTGKRRNAHNNFQLGLMLAMIAGAVNAGGFFLVMQYTSHMTGIISLAADSAAIGEYTKALQLSGYIFCFIIGAACTAAITLTAKRYHLHSQFALPLLLEAFILMAFALFWYGVMPQEQALPYFIAALCFMMGLQNALITKISSAIIRTTHITGMTTDLGIEIGRLLFGAKFHDPRVAKNNLKRHISIICAFLVGGIAGAIFVNKTGALILIIIASLLTACVYPPLKRDFLFFTNNTKRKGRAS